MEEPNYDVVIIGGGVTGMGAAVYAGRFQMKTAVVTGEKGGTIVNTDDVANYPGFKQISGLDLAEKVEEHAKEYDIELVEKKVTKITRCKEGCLKVYTGEDHLHTRSIIFATGTTWRKLGVPGEEDFAKRGVHYCALCDGPLYRDKTLAIVGGSDSAAKEALLLAEYAKRVYVIYRRDRIHAEPINVKRVEDNPRIEVIPNTNVLEIKGDKTVDSVTLDTDYKGSRQLKLDGLFVAVGHTALSGLAKDIGVELNEKGEIKIDQLSRTNVKMVYAAGDVADTPFKQAITGVAEGVKAAYAAYTDIDPSAAICWCDDNERGD
jgi:thioredoxin reductase (NADPH)